MHRSTDAGVTWTRVASGVAQTLFGVRVRASGQGWAVGADGVMVEVHPDPDQALSDAEQQLTLEQFRSMMATIVPIHELVRAAGPEPVLGDAALKVGGGGKH